ncbi:MAG: restriction endonuclease subunit S [Deltaproteobacteria bacterium]
MKNLITKNIDIWTSAQTQKTSGAGRGNHSANSSLHGMKKLRELILELAVRGKLVPQDPNDEPASVLLEKIAKEKARLIKEGKLKKQEPLPKITEEEKPFELPDGWCVIQLGNIGYWAIGSGFPLNEQGVEGEGILFSKVSDMNLPGNDKFLLTATNTISKESANRLKIYVHSKGTVIFPKIGGAIATNKRRILVRPTAIDNNCLGLSPTCGISSEYLYLYLTSIDFTKYQAGTSIPALSQGSLALITLGLPPLTEQCRIVAKVDELMAICDHLEQQQTDSKAAHQTLVEALLATLTNVANQDEFAEAWQLIASHFNVLFTTEQSINQLKQTILQLAVMGKLVPQDPKDEPASVLLARIAKEKARLIKEGKIKKQEPLPEISENENPFELPERWEWTRLGNLSANIHYGYTASAEHGNSGIRLLRITDIQNDSVNWETVPGCEIEEDKANDYLLENEDILIARTGGTIGKSYLVENIDVKAVFASYLIRVKRIEGMYSPFIKTYLGSQLYWQQLYKNSMGTGQPNVNATALKGLVFPIPPLAEQHRIVAKVDELMALCDSLKDRLNEAQTTQIQLADTIVEQAVVYDMCA